MDYSKTFIRNEEVIEAEIDGEKVMMDIESGHYYGLDTVAGQIWQLLEQPMNLSQLVETLTAEFEVSAEQCQNDIAPFLEDLEKNGLISVS
jgi:DNA-directed RNA polymerase delta subunit